MRCANTILVHAHSKVVLRNMGIANRDSPTMHFSIQALIQAICAAFSARMDRRHEMLLFWTVASPLVGELFYPFTAQKVSSSYLT
jgi:hypothetical protein